MSWILFGLFVLVPLCEIALFIVVGQQIGTLMTIILVIFTALLGTFLLQMQGMSALLRAQKAMAEGRVPMDSVIDGMCLMIAGAFLLTPGFLTDSIGFLLFIPQFRRTLAKWVFQQMLKSKSVHFETYTMPGDGKGSHNSQSGKPGADPGSGPIIEGEFEEKEKRPTSESGVPLNPKGSSPWRKDGE